MRTARYYLLSFLTFLISLVGLVGLKLVAVGIGFGIAFLTEKYIGDWGLTIGWIIGLFAAGLLLAGLQCLSPYLERLDNYTESFKKYPDTDKYGINYCQPTAEEFGITPEEFKDYNKRFQFEFIQIIFTYGIWIAAMIYVIQGKIKGTPAIFIVGITGMAAIILNYLFDYWNKKISMKHRYYDKIHKFQQSLHIYLKIRDENSKI